MSSIKSIAALAAISVATLGFAGSAEAGHWHDGGYAAGAGLFGFATGAIVGSALARDYEPRVIYVQPQNDWVSYCYSRHPSYNPATNLYLGYDRRYHVCR